MIHQRTLSNPRAEGGRCARSRGPRTAALAALLVLATPASAEDERGRWTLSFGGGILSTFDDIRNNAAVVRLLDVGRTGDISDDPVAPGSFDLRQDDLLGRETSAEEVQTFNFGVAYGLTPWLSMQVDLGYYKGNVSNLDTFQINRRFSDINQDNTLTDANPDERVETPFRDASVPIGVGELEQIPLTVSAVFRFRRDSPFNPILGAGVGWVFTDLQESQVFGDLNAEILRGFQRTQVFGDSASNLQLITDARGNQVVNTDCAMPANRLGQGVLACNHASVFIESEAEKAKADGTYFPGFEEALHQAITETFPEALNPAFVPTRPLVTAEVSDGFAYQVIGGAEYHFNERWSVYMLGRYLATKAALRIRIRDNGNLFTAQPTDPGTQPVQPVRFDLKEALFKFNAEGNIEGALGSGPGQQPRVLEDEIYVQGGDINLTSFSLIFGLRYTF